MTDISDIILNNEMLTTYPTRTGTGKDSSIATYIQHCTGGPASKQNEKKEMSRA